MKQISKLGLELIQFEGGLLLIDKNSKIEKGDLFEFDTLICIYDGTYHLSTGREHKIIASTKPLEGLPLLVIEDEVENLANQAEIEEYKDNDPYDQFYAGCDFYEGFKQGYNKAKETYKFTEEDLRKALWELGDVLFNNNQNGIKEGEPELYFDTIIQSITKKELYVEVDCEYGDNCPSKGAYDKQYLCKIVPKIINNQIKAVWK